MGQKLSSTGGTHRLTVFLELSPRGTTGEITLFIKYHATQTAETYLWILIHNGYPDSGHTYQKVRPRYEACTHRIQTDRPCQPHRSYGKQVD